MPNDTEVEVATKPLYDILLEAIYSEDPNFKTQEEGESDRDYLIRFMEGVASTPLQSTFEALPEDARDWFNNTANSLSDDSSAAVEMPQGFVSVYDEAAAQPRTEKKKRGRPAGSTSEKKTKTVKEPKVKAKKDGNAATTTIREAVVANPRATAEQINEILVKAGFKSVQNSTIMTTRHSALGTLRAAQKAGMLKEGVDLPA